MLISTFRFSNGVWYDRRMIDIALAYPMLFCRSSGSSQAISLVTKNVDRNFSDSTLCYGKLHMSKNVAQHETLGSHYGSAPIALCLFGPESAVVDADHSAGSLDDATLRLSVNGNYRSAIFTCILTTIN
jgi:hypothetical protein